MIATPQNLSPLLAQSLSAYYDRVRRKVHTLVDPLSTEQLWLRPFQYGNSIGHLLLHLTGNLNYYIGAQMAGSGYVRDRPMEFGDKTRRPVQEVLQDFDRAVDMVISTLSVQNEADWSATFSGAGAEDVPDRFSMFLRCAAHADHHTGQMIYLAKQLSLGDYSGVMNR